MIFTGLVISFDGTAVKKEVEKFGHDKMPTPNTNNNYGDTILVTV